jgi:hypothetical protein
VPGFFTVGGDWGWWLTDFLRLVGLPFEFVWILLKIWIRFLAMVLTGGWLFGDAT